MLKAVFRPEELVALPEKVVIDPSSFSVPAYGKVDDEEIEEINDVEEYTGPTADDLRREAEAFKAHWEEEKERMIADANTEAERIVKDAEQAAFQEVKRKTDEAQVIKQQAEEEAEGIIAAANEKAVAIENEIRQTLDAERTDAQNKGREEGRKDGFDEGKAEVERLIERTQVVLERAQNKRGEILSETEQEIIDLVLLISRKVIKVLSDNQRDIIVSNVTQALRKVKAKGNVIIRVNLADLKLATEHKQDFINLLEGAKSVQVVEDSTVDSGGCIIETDFGEIDARISSQLAELESKILEISPERSSIKDNIPPPVVRTANLNADLAASTAMLNEAAAAAAAAESAPAEKSGGAAEEDTTDPDVAASANAALTASAALAALATMGMKGKRQSDKDFLKNMMIPGKDKS